MPENDDLTFSTKGKSTAKLHPFYAKNTCLIKLFLDLPKNTLPVTLLGMQTVTCIVSSDT